MSIPFYGKRFTFTQPDGAKVNVVGYGNSYRAVFETPDGYTIVPNPQNGFYEYASVSPDGQQLIPTGVRADRPAPTGLKQGLGPGLPMQQDPVFMGLSAQGKSRWLIRRERMKHAIRESAARGAFFPAPPQRQTIGKYVGLCLLVQFPDVPGTISRQQVEAFCNQPGYTGYGNNGSVFDYFQDNSEGKLQYTNVVALYYTAKHIRSYYTDSTIGYGIRARELILEALAYLKSIAFDFSPLTSDGDGYVYALNVFYAGEIVNNWSQGLWPHAHYLQSPYELVPGKWANDYQITNMSDELTLATFCHENGHMICDFPDLYDYGNESLGIGVYCLMCFGGSDDRNPANICAYLKYQAGWASRVTSLANGMTAVATAGRNWFFIHRKNQVEYFLIENRIKAGRDASLTDSGLAVWHVDETGDNSHEHMTPGLHYECSLVQADGNHDLEHRTNSGDHLDLFENGNFGDSTMPHSRWWDGTSSRLELRDIGSAGPEIRFSVKL